ncbi:unnamed protein product [Cyprideis torosa]|uniref:Uncharacterized protein n=1 Tax=Cyprideis torosa TaxID=163714 RepID=A0A7R8WBR3_9CRUS|nr:unnamed protein product [Cyprideis torosa]CAG0889888.1 unnamed protein product [Cyprideis torosa]
MEGSLNTALENFNGDQDIENFKWLLELTAADPESGTVLKKTFESTKEFQSVHQANHLRLLNDRGYNGCKHFVRLLEEDATSRVWNVSKGIKCDYTARYRSIDGTCNSGMVNTWGATNIPLRNMLPPDYFDDVSEPRGGRGYTTLPNPRHVSYTVHQSEYKNDCIYALMVMQFGQFMDHDITNCGHQLLSF